MNQKLLETTNQLYSTQELNNDASPFGKWTARKVSSRRIINQLFRKEFISKIRHPPSIIEFLGACFVAALLYPVWLFARKTIHGTLQPPMYNGTIEDFATELIQFVYFTQEPKLVFLPDDFYTRLLQVSFKEAFDAMNATQMSYYIVNTTDEMREKIYSSDSNGIGIYWVNSNESIFAYQRPIIQIYKQTLTGDPEGIILAMILKILSELHLTRQDWSIMPFQEFAQPTHDDLYDIQIIVALFAIIPVVLATMPSLQSILLEKDLHVTHLIFMMGCTEVQYWFVQIVFMIVSGYIPYILFGIMMCYLFAMVGTSFTLFLFFSFLFVVAHCFFLLCIISFFKHASTGHAMTVVTALFVIFFGYLHYFYTLNENNSSESLKHGLSVIPLSAYQLLILMCFNRIKNGFPGVGWADIFDNSYEYPIWYGLAWLTAECFFYLLLWILFNATNPRNFGIQLIRWKDFFKKQAWKRIFSPSIDPKDMESLYSAKIAIEVNNVTKVFKGKKPIVAVDDVSFTINQGEVIVMIGPNGAGKSTLINTISGALLSDSGNMSLFGKQPTTHFTDIHQYLGICFQDNVLIPLMNVREHFFLFGAFRGISEEDLNNAISYFSDNLQLQECLYTRSIDLSGGQKRKLCLALALLGNPPIVIMDEPTAGVDVQARQLIWKTIAGLKNSTCLITSHALEEAEAVSSRLFIVAKGQVPYRGTSTELRQQFKCGYLLRVEREDGKVGPVLDLVRKHIPDARITEEREDSITMPVNKNVPVMLHELVDRKEELGVVSYSFAVEQLEDMLLNMVETAEAQIEQNF
ncbi:ABC transporter family protein [Tritrichomonas foetus]|uniref:ABC transporter family protein n=1 Tax=Tritrichomonas foetus TaxID=1144522 RepID=A0A1J4KTI5_9EUKA|nr:ABC transporter family protein [Tritrichomonas foetus]|eukprot:OHT14208.1 ABC transporter family protein [Tritrichomonas foetus]